MKIVSLFPAATEIVCALGMADKLVGVSHACPRLPELASIPRLTTWRGPVNGSGAEIDAEVSRLARAGEPLFSFDSSLFARLQADVVLSQSLCDVCAIDESTIRRMIRSAGARIWEWSPRSVNDILRCITDLGKVCNEAEKGEELASAVRCRLFNVRYLTGLIGEPTNVAYLEWLDPLYCAGHWVPELVEFAGGRDVLGTAGKRSHKVTFDQLAKANPEVIVIGCCGWSESRTKEAFADIADRADWQSLQAVKNGRLHIVDAESCFTSPGISIADAVEQLAQLIHFSINSNNTPREHLTQNR